MYKGESTILAKFITPRGVSTELSAEKLPLIHGDMWSNSHLSRVPAALLPAIEHCLDDGPYTLVNALATLSGLAQHFKLSFG